MSNPIQSKTFYEIFRSCRLCGAGGGYKMPIIQSAIGIDFSDVELRQKIKECVQIEVVEDDKMPPLICELCIDKVNDFYEFLGMCKEINKNTRLRLGLPAQTTSQGMSESDDCILGDTEPVFINNSPRPGPKSKKTEKKAKNEDKTEKILKENEKRISSMQKENEKRISSIQKENEKRISSMQKEMQELRRLLAEQAEQTNKTAALQTKSKNFSAPQSRGQKSESRSSSATGSSSSIDRLESQKKNEKGKPAPIKSTLKTETESQKKNEKGKPAPIKSTLKTETPGRSRDTRASAESRSSSLSGRSTSSMDRQEIVNTKKKNDKNTPAPPKSILKKIDKVFTDSDDDALVLPVSKRSREKEKEKAMVETPPKKIKLSAPEKSSFPCNVCGISCKSQTGLVSHLKSHANAKPSAEIPCDICGVTVKTAQGLFAHQKTHDVTYTPQNLACNACGEWFPSAALAAAHHRAHKHKVYHCRHCSKDFTTYTDYNSHVSGDSCVSWAPSPPVKCPACFKSFITDALRRAHTCAGDTPVMSKCRHCKKDYKVTWLKKHENQCISNNKSKSKADSLSTVKISPSVRRRLLVARVRVSRCDALMRNKNRVNVKHLDPVYGLDKKSVYPYFKVLKIKKEPISFDGMVSIGQEVKDEIYKEEDYVHWDSDLSSDSDDDLQDTEAKKVDSLTILSLKTLFSRRCLGKVPRKLRKVKSNKLFDSMFNDNEEFSTNIDNIIDNLEDEENTDKLDKVSFDIDSFGNSDSMLEGQDHSLINDNVNFDSLINDKPKDKGIVYNDSETDASGDNISTNDRDDKVDDSNAFDLLRNNHEHNENDGEKSIDANSHNDLVGNDADRRNDEDSHPAQEVDAESHNDLVRSHNHPEESRQTDEDNTANIYNDLAGENVETNDRKNEDDQENETRSDFPNDSTNNLDTNMETNETNGDSYENNETEKNDNIGMETNEATNNDTENNDKINGKTNENDKNMNDRALLDEIDAQIGEGEARIEEISNRSRSNGFSVEDLLDKGKEYDSVSQGAMHFDV